MNRLTSYRSNCKREMICRYENCDTCEEYCPHMNEDNCPCLQEVLEKLAEYEDLGEQGRLLKLPCSVGDTVYFIKSNFSYLSKPKEENIRKIELYSNEIIFRTQERSFGIDKIGKIVFLTRQEAEDKLAEMEGKN